MATRVEDIAWELKSVSEDPITAKRLEDLLDEELEEMRENEKS